MRIYFNSMALPKKAAKRFHSHFKGANDLKLSTAQAMTAMMLGYRNWHELEQVTKSGKNEPSLLDENVSEDIQMARIDYQTEVLARWSPLIEPARKDLALKLRVSGGAPTATGLLHSSYSNNHLHGWVDPFKDREEWIFYRSQRTEAVHYDIQLIKEVWANQQLTFDEIVEKVNPYLQKHPENITAIATYLEAISDFQKSGSNLKILKRFSKEVEKCIPDNIPVGRLFIDYWNIQNRDFIRTMFFLGECFYSIGQMDQAEKWFKLLISSCPKFVSEAAPYLVEIETLKAKQ